MDFASEITTLDELRTLIAPPNELVTRKEIAVLDDLCREFIGRSPFLVIASTDGAGRVDTSPKGDPAGFVRVLDDRTLAIPERPGNHRADTLVNVVRHPWVGLILLVPGSRNTLRIRGRARIVTDPELLASMAERGRTPVLALVVEVTTAYFHCGKCILRSGLWDDTDERAAEGTLLAEAMVVHGDLALSVDAMRDIIVDDEQERLY